MPSRHRAIAAAATAGGRPPSHLASAPGRVNLIGEHTDHQEGFVLPLAIEQRTWIAFTPWPHRRVSVRADDLDKHTEFDLERLTPRPRTWSNYLIGVAHMMLEANVPIHGWIGAIASDVPRGAALSSSAALEVAATLAFVAEPSTWQPTSMALIGQRAENEWVGVSSGIMDQLVSAAATDGAALFIDCRSLETEPVTLAAGTTVVVMDTATRRGLVGSAYNERRQACERAAAFFGARLLRDVSTAQLKAAESQLPELDYRRARHVVTENDRVLAAVECAGDPCELGRLMDASHNSMAVDFEISTPELDAMVGIARRQPGCHGARMTGGGFGGAAVALVDDEALEPFMAAVAVAYEAATGLHPNVFATRPAGGARLEELAA